MTQWINLTWQHISIALNKQGGTIRIINCDCIYMTVLSPLTGTSSASYKIWKWDNLTVEQVTIICACAIWRQCLNSTLSVLTHWLVQCYYVFLSKNECDLKVWVGMRVEIFICMHPPSCISAITCVCWYGVPASACVAVSVFSTYSSSRVIPVTNGTVVSTPPPTTSVVGPGVRNSAAHMIILLSLPLPLSVYITLRTIKRNCDQYDGIGLHQ